MNSLSSLDYLIVFIYLLGIITLGVWIARKVKGFTSFFVAGRMMTTPLLISTLVSTYYGLDVTFGVSEVSFSEGVVSWFIYTRPYYIGIIVASLILIRRLKAFPFLSLPDVAEHFYGKAGRLMVALASLLYNLPFLAIMGMGILFRVTLGLPEMQGYLIGAAIAAVYTILGGLWADAITDTLQFALMCITLAIALPFALELVGGFDWMLAHMDAKYFTPAGEIPFAYRMALIMTVLSVFVEPAFYQRIFAAKDERSVRNALLIGIVIWAAYAWAATLLGLDAAAAVKQNILPANLMGREALLQIVLISLPIGLKGFFIAGVLSSAMSTVDSYLLLAGGNLVYDLYRPFVRPNLSEASLLKLTRIGIVIVLIPSLAVAIYFQRISDAWVFMSTLLTGTAFIPIMAGLFLPGKRKPLEGLLSSLFGLGAIVIYYTLVTFLGHPENESYVLRTSLFSHSWDIWREYSLFFALPASVVGFLLGSTISRAWREKS